VLNYGFVPIGQSLPICQRIWNHDKAKMLIKCSILSTDNDDVLENSPFKVSWIEWIIRNECIMIEETIRKLKENKKQKEITVFYGIKK
jgi:hypothetical protein